MKAFFHSILTAALLFAVPAAVADELPDSVRQRPVYPIEEVVVTGTRNETDVRPPDSAMPADLPADSPQ